MAPAKILKFRKPVKGVKKSRAVAAKSFAAGAEELRFKLAEGQLNAITRLLEFFEKNPDKRNDAEFKKLKMRKQELLNKIQGTSPKKTLKAA